MNTDIATLAREVLDMTTHDDEDEFTYVSDRDFSRAAWIAPDLARAVLDVQAVVEEFAYAATLDRGLSEWEGMCDHFVKKFHAALNGGDA